MMITSYESGVPLVSLASSLIKIALRILGCFCMELLDLVDEYRRVSESTCLESMYMFCKVVLALFGPENLREPNVEDIARLLAINKARGFHGMLDNIDCMNWEWNNCPFA